MNTALSERVLEILEWPAISREIASRCMTSPGKQALETLSPLEKEEAENRMAIISALKESSALGNPIDFPGINDISPLLDRTEKEAVLLLEELFDVRRFVTGSARVRGFLKEAALEYPVLRPEYESIQALEVLEEKLLPALTDNGDLNEQRFPQLKKLRRGIIDTRGEIEKVLNKLITTPSLEKVLQERTYTTSSQRYVLLVKSGMKNSLSGTVHDISSSGQTVYFEPDQVKDLNNRYIMLELELQQEIYRILRDLSGEVASSASELRVNLAIIGYLDFCNGAARFSADTGGSAPLLKEEALIDLKKVHHPLLYLKDPGATIANNVALGIDYSGIIISGANTGGKTVLLKTVGLAVLFTMLGLHVPASPDSSMGIFSSILGDIGDDQNLEQSLSTFSGQIVIINEMLARSDDRTLVLIDEIIVGTNPRQGSALARAILESMAETGSRIMVTTHYAELKELASEDSRFTNASVSFDLDTLKPTYNLMVGLPGVSYALEIARNYAMPEAVLERSRELMDSSDLSVESLLEETRRYRQELEEERQRVQHLKEDFARREEKFQKKNRELERLSERLKRSEGIDFLEEIKKYRGQVADKIRGLQQADLKEAGKIQKDLIGLETSYTEKLQTQDKKEAGRERMPLSPHKASPGGKVYVASLDQHGVIESIESDGSTAVVLFGGTIRSRFKIEDLHEGGGSFPAPKKNTAREKNRGTKKTEIISSEKIIPNTIQTSYNTIDLRGMRVEEALRRMESDLDGMQRDSISAAVIIHGHGTGALKNAVRDALKMSIYVADFRPGEAGEGSDGVTIARLRQ